MDLDGFQNRFWDNLLTRKRDVFIWLKKYGTPMRHHQDMSFREVPKIHLAVTLVFQSVSLGFL
tara:strand:+ start:575 stop:763 length:189 start_codon:yes stop_codon:yes gene_type:complete